MKRKNWRKYKIANFLTGAILAEATSYADAKKKALLLSSQCKIGIYDANDDIKGTVSLNGTHVVPKY